MLHWADGKNVLGLILMHYSNEKLLTVLFTYMDIADGQLQLLYIFFFLLCLFSGSSYISPILTHSKMQLWKDKKLCSQIYRISNVMLDKDKCSFCFTYIARRLIWFHISYWSAVSAHFSSISRCWFPFNSDSFLLMFQQYRWT